MGCVALLCRRNPIHDDMTDLKLPGMGVHTTMRHLRPRPPKRDRRNRAPTTVFAPVAEEQPHSEEEEEEEEAKTGGSDDAKDEGGQAGERTVGSQSLMQRLSICTVSLKPYGPGIAI